MKLAINVMQGLCVPDRKFLDVAPLDNRFVPDRGNVISSPTDVSLYEKSRMYRLLDGASRRRCVPDRWVLEH
jgi:hypothetical protein